MRGTIVMTECFECVVGVVIGACVLVVGSAWDFSTSLLVCLDVESSTVGVMLNVANSRADGVN